MRQTLLRIAPILRLTRVTTAFAAVGNVWFVILWARFEEADRTVDAVRDRPLWLLLLGGWLLAVSLYAFGAALNDILDVRRDRALHPGRPLASGRLTIDTAVGVVALTLMSATLGATALDTPAVVLTLLTAWALLLYHAAAKFIPSVGVVLLSLIYALHMLIPDPGLEFLLPVWLVMTHALVVALVTHHLAERRPRLSTGAILAAVAGWLFWSGVLAALAIVHGALWPDTLHYLALAGPGALAAMFVALVVWKVRSASSPARGADKLARYGALWLTLYNTAWLAGAGQLGPALILGGLAVAGFLGMTLLREMYGFVEQPLVYRL